MKTVVFDLGGTLMQYVGMPYSWVDFYYGGVGAIILTDNPLPFLFSETTNTTQKGRGIRND
ncbi:hypothetical protein [Parablautia muri]|uniref:Uncharacterized protein n=1 Tax=Parablautia muri TaxID=2320879 RepID=A0A9X5BHA9_9FIRM|nr:hypothetical protein [Parablautia muri]NBJ94050.1 hypothetical protein [Parablautia muri]